MIIAFMLLLRRHPHLQFSGLVVLAVLCLPLLPGLYLTLKLRFSKSTDSPFIILSPATEDDLLKLSTFPIKADWPVLLSQTNSSYSLPTRKR